MVVVVLVVISFQTEFDTTAEFWHAIRAEISLLVLKTFPNLPGLSIHSSSLRFYLQKMPEKVRHAHDS